MQLRDEGSIELRREQSKAKQIGGRELREKFVGKLGRTSLASLCS